MKPLTLYTTPSSKPLYSIKTFEGENFPLPYHKHERYELTCIMKGSGMRIIGDHIREYENGDVVLMAPFLAHQWQSDSNRNKKVSAISVFFKEEFPSRDFQQLKEFETITRLKQLARRGIELKGTLRKKTADALKGMGNTGSLEQMTQLLLVLNEISTSGEYELLSGHEPVIHTSSGNETMGRIVQYISSHLEERISVREIADSACMHPGSVGRFFKQSTGFGLVEYINLLKIGKACELLNDTTKNINTIALECGFENLSYFNRCFKGVKKMTPREYRMNHYHQTT